MLIRNMDDVQFVDEEESLAVNHLAIPLVPGDHVRVFRYRGSLFDHHYVTDVCT